MSTVKIKTEPTAATAVDDVKVKLEPSLSTSDIKLEQHISDIDTKVEPDSDIDSEEEDIKSESDDDDDDDDTDQFTIIPNSQRHFICEHYGCSHSFTTASNLKRHQNEHCLQAEIYVYGKIYSLARKSLDDSWPCPTPDCETMSTTVDGVCKHIRQCHSDTIGQQQQHSPGQKTRRIIFFPGVDNFYVGDIRCGYHNTTGVFICHECKLVPECLLTHLQQKHGYNEKTIDNAFLPDTARITGSDPNGYQHTSNSHLASAIRHPYQQQHLDIVQGWLCVAANCGYCSYTKKISYNHQCLEHKGKKLSIVPALVLRLLYSKSRTRYFLITCIDQASSAVTTSSSRVNWHNGLDAQDGSENDSGQNETEEESNQTDQWKCAYQNCRRIFSSVTMLSIHRREHKLHIVITAYDRVFTLTRQSSDDRWQCPILDCEITCKSVRTIYAHILNIHSIWIKQKHVISEDDDYSQEQQQVTKKKHQTIRIIKVDDFYVNGVRCGYHNTIGVFICHECRLVPECLLTHLQQKHGYDEKSIDNSVLPDSAITANADPNINQHISNTHLSSAISQPRWRYHRDIIQGWLCVTSDCGYCGISANNKYDHKKYFHQDEQLTTVPALVLRLLYGKIQTSCYLIVRLDTAASSVNSNKSTSQHDGDCDYDDGDELVLSDYSD